MKKYKIGVRNHLGLKQTNDWIYNLNIGNVMHLSLMSSEELSPLDKEINLLSKSTTNTMTMSALDQAGKVQEASQYDNSLEL